MERRKYFGIMFWRSVPLYLLWVIFVFFLVYQTAIGNPFDEDIHPSLVLGVAVVLSSVLIYFLSTFSIRKENKTVRVRVGFYFISFTLDNVREVIEVTDRPEFTYGVFANESEVVFKVSRGKVGISIVLNSGKKITFLGDSIRMVVESILRDR